MTLSKDTLTRTAWAAGIPGDDSLGYTAGEDKLAVIDELVTRLLEDVEQGGYEPGVFDVEVLADVTWCVGTDDLEDCTCGSIHDAYVGPWVLYTRSGEREAWTVTVRLDGDTAICERLVPQAEDATQGGSR